MSCEISRESLSGKWPRATNFIFDILHVNIFISRGFWGQKKLFQEVLPKKKCREILVYAWARDSIFPPHVDKIQEDVVQAYFYV
jgi:acid phosphatase class B